MSKATKVAAEYLELDSIVIVGRSTQLRVLEKRATASGRVDLACIDTRTAKPVYIESASPSRLFSVAAIARATTPA